MRSDPARTPTARPGLTLATRIFVGYAVVLTSFGAVSLYAVAELHRGREELGLISGGYLPLSQDATALQTLHQGRHRDIQRVIAEGDLATRGALIRLTRLYFPSLLDERLSGARARLRALSSGGSPDRADFVAAVEGALADLEARQSVYLTTTEALFTAIAARPDSPAPQELSAALTRHAEAFERGLRRLQATLESGIRERVLRAERRERRSAAAILGLSLAAVLVGIVATAASARSLRPIRRLTEEVARLRAGDFRARVGLSGRDDISLLAREFDGMADALEARETELAEKQAALVRAERLAAVGRLAAQVAHEVRNPLSSIGLNAELLQEAIEQARFPRPEDASEASTLLTAIVREVERLEQTTHRYLDLAKGPAPEARLIDVDALLDDVVAFMAPELQRSKVTVSREGKGPSPEAFADPALVRQALVNLIRNAQEAMPRGGRLVLTTRAREGSVEIEVTDEGGGVPPSLGARLFEPFASTKPGGTGLGLSASRQLLRAQGGELLHRPGELGATFVIRLPPG